MHNLFRPDVPPHIADVIRSLDPDLKRSVRAAIDEIAANPECGEPLRGELNAYWKYRVRRFRIIYAVDRGKRMTRVMAIAHRREVYEQLAAQLKDGGSKK
ncbi:MAG: type II toxin-antitoxin system RelE/ParE family toxin [Acidobacteria bacterium]|nr:type II toxin-antitoxin system RelE/ParE family toxin [Acidobacteriota bacterium]